MHKSVVLGVLIAILAVLAAIYYSPPTDDFDPGNPFWNGLSQASEKLSLVEVSDLRLIQYESPANSALLIVGPSKPFTPEEVESIREFLRQGGLLIIADEFGSANELLETLGVGVRLNGSVVFDPLFKERSGRLPRVFDLAPELVENGTESLVLNYATVVEGTGFRPLARSSSFSFLDLDVDGEWDAGEPRGPFVVAAELTYLGGKIVVISDSSILINSMLRLGDNLEFTRAILGERTPLLDASHWAPSRFALAKGLLTQVVAYLHAPEARYGLLMLTLAYVSRLRLPSRVGRPAEARENLEEVLKAHPEWERDVIERLAKDLAD